MTRAPRVTAVAVASPSFDRVRLADRELTIDEFLALPLPDRVRMILGRDLVFTMAGKPVPRDVALRSLMGHR